MEFNIFYKKKKDWFIGHIQEYPDYESQGRTLDELRENLIEIYYDINEEQSIVTLVDFDHHDNIYKA